MQAPRPELSLHQRRRPPTAAELAGIPWLRLLAPASAERAARDITVGDALPGDFVCRVGRPVTYWFGVIEGLLKMSTDNAQGQTRHLHRRAARAAGSAKAPRSSARSTATTSRPLRNSVVAGLPVDTFHWLLDHSIGFNRFVMNQLNERLAQFIAAREIDRMNNPDVRVARSLAALFNPVLYPGVGEVLRITQQELAYLVGLSRQRVNEALAALQAQGAIRVEYGGLRVLDLQALRADPPVAVRRLPDNRCMPPESIAPTTRLNKRMAELGLCSRREADDWIAKGWVRVERRGRADGAAGRAGCPHRGRPACAAASSSSRSRSCCTSRWATSAARPRTATSRR